MQTILKIFSPMLLNHICLNMKTTLQDIISLLCGEADNEVAAWKRALQFLDSSYANDLITYKKYLEEKMEILGLYMMLNLTVEKPIKML